MGRIAWIAVALVFLTAAPAAQAGWLSALARGAKIAAEDAAKAGTKSAEAAANGIKIENKLSGIEATGVSVEANGVKIAPGGGGSGGGNEGAPVWFYVLCAAGAAGWFLLKFRAKRA
jgi:hypothetical protein